MLMNKHKSFAIAISTAFSSRIIAAFITGKPTQSAKRAFSVYHSP
jgi:hypothetical protein